MEHVRPQSPTGNLTISYVHVSKLTPAPYNPRKITPEEMGKLKLSLSTYGFVDPAIVQTSTNLVIGGHQRIEAARQLGWTEVPVVYIDIDDTKAKTLNLALNKISGDWDFPKLKDLFVELDTGALDLAITGFDLNEIKKIFDYNPAQPPKPPQVSSGSDQDNSVICPNCHHEFEA